MCQTITTKKQKTTKNYNTDPVKKVNYEYSWTHVRNVCKPKPCSDCETVTILAACTDCQKKFCLSCMYPLADGVTLCSKCLDNRYEAVKKFRENLDL